MRLNLFCLALTVSLFNILPAQALPKYLDNLYGTALAREMDNVIVVKASPAVVSQAIESYMHNPKFWNANSNCQATEKTPAVEVWQCSAKIGTEKLESRIQLVEQKPDKTQIILEQSVIDPDLIGSNVERHTKFDPKAYSSRFKTSLALQGSMVLNIKMIAEKNIFR